MRILFDTFHKSLGQFFDEVDLNEVEAVFTVLLNCKGTVFFSGIGKSGLIAQKIAATFVSTGTRAIYLAPIDALHGDIGLVSPKDVFFSFSRSGESEEILTLLPYVKKKGALTMSAVSRRCSRISQASDVVVVLPVHKELCPYDLAPTTSSVVQLIFGDCLAIALMKAKQYTINDFAENHPGGLLGRKSSLKVSDLMIKEDEIPLCFKQDKLIDVLHELTGKRCGCILITNEERELYGIFTDGDLRRAIQTNGESALQMTMYILGTGTPRTTEPDQYAFHALQRMEEDPNRLIAVLPVLTNKKIVGLLRLHDILQAGLR